MPFGASAGTGWRRLAGFVSLLLALGGCASVAPGVPGSVGNNGARTTSDIRSFALSGRIGVKYDGQGFYGNLRWRHGVDGDDILILSPLGQGVAHITRQAGQGVTLTTAEGKTYRAADVATLTQQVLGWQLPLEGLQYWVLGVDDPAGAVSAPRADGFSQDGWRITYLSSRQVAGRSLPDKLVLERPDLTVRLVVDQWDISPAPAL